MLDEFIGNFCFVFSSMNQISELWGSERRQVMSALPPTRKDNDFGSISKIK